MLPATMMSMWTNNRLADYLNPLDRVTTLFRRLNFSSSTPKIWNQTSRTSTPKRENSLPNSETLPDEQTN